jgi:4-hydroxy-3-polyprenylbenzoate decarboxylase
MKRFILAITGASGPRLGLYLLRELSKVTEVYLVISDSAIMILKEEEGIDIAGKEKKEVLHILSSFIKGKVHYFKEDEMDAPISSGSFKTDGMFIVPCSMKTLGAISNGYAGNLIERAADVILKERRPLIISPREMPFSPLHLENMLKLSRLGVVIAPPVPAFYHKPENLEDMINFIIGRLLDEAGIEHNLYRRWATPPLS